MTVAPAPATDEAQRQAPRLRIGEMAKETGVTPRTLRYWEEIGLLKPAAHRGGGERLYSVAEQERVTHIRELQDLLGLPLAEIHDVLASEDTLERARRAARADAPTPKRLRLLVDAIEANARLVERIDERLSRIVEFRDECADRGQRMRARRAELEADLGPASR
ncbi:MAG: MerR family transcriptional regulator [Acidimicrobiales bacterium]